MGNPGILFAPTFNQSAAKYIYYYGKITYNGLGAAISVPLTFKYLKKDFWDKLMDSEQFKIFTLQADQMNGSVWIQQDGNGIEGLYGFLLRTVISISGLKAMLPQYTITKAD